MLLVEDQLHLPRVLLDKFFAFEKRLDKGTELLFDFLVGRVVFPELMIDQPGQVLQVLQFGPDLLLEVRLQQQLLEAGVAVLNLGVELSFVLAKGELEFLLLRLLVVLDNCPFLNVPLKLLVNGLEILPSHRQLVSAVVLVGLGVGVADLAKKDLGDALLVPGTALAKEDLGLMGIVGTQLPLNQVVAHLSIIPSNKYNSSCRIRGQASPRHPAPPR